MPSQRRRVELVHAEALSPSVRSLVFATSDGAPLLFQAGQYVDLFAPAANGMIYKRPYSVASPPEPRSPRFELAVTRVEGGPLSTALHATPLGALAEIEGPRGLFVRGAGAGRDALFVATGTGLAPIRAMLAEELRAERGPRITLLFGCRTEADILWSRELHAWSASRPRFRLETTLSRGGAGWRGRRGHVQLHAKELMTGLGDSAHAYVCGLAKMVDDVVSLLETSAGIPRSQLHLETYD